MFLQRRTTTTGGSHSPVRALAATTLALALLAAACGGSTTAVDGATDAASSGDTGPDTALGATTPVSADPTPTADDVAAPAATQVPDSSLPTEFVVSMPGPGVPIADGYVAHRPVDCGDERDFRQALFDFAVPAGWNDDIGNSVGSQTGTTYAANLSADATDDIDIRNQEFLLIQIGGYITHGTALFDAPIQTPEIPRRTQWFGEDDLDPLTVVGEATVGGEALPVYHSQTQGIEDQYGQIGGDIAVWQVTGTAATWPVPDATGAGRLDYRILVATDYSRTDLPTEFRIDEAQAIGIIESVQASACLRPLLIEAAANHWDAYTLE